MRAVAMRTAEAFRFAAEVLLSDVRSLTRLRRVRDDIAL